MKPIHFLFVFFLSLASNANTLNFSNSGDSLKAKSPSFKNKIALEIIGNPLVLSYEREFYNKGKVSLAGHIGLNFPMMLFTHYIPGFSIGMNTNVSLNKRWSFSALTKFDAFALTLPAKSWSFWTQGYIYSLNLMSINVGTALCYRKTHLEIAPIYPCFMYSIGLVSDGEDGFAALYPSISLCSKIAYKF